MYRKGEPLKRGILFLWLAAIYVFASLLTFAGTTRLANLDIGLVFAFVWAGAMVATVPLLTESKTRWGWVFVVWLFGGIVVAVPPIVGTEAWLAAQGVPAQARIVGVEAVVEDSQVLFSLRDDSGRDIPGLLLTDGGHALGSHVDVVVDPYRVVNPKLAEELAGVSPSTGPTIFAVVFGLQLVFCWLAAKPRRQQLDVASTPWLQQGVSILELIGEYPWSRVGFGVFFMLVSLVFPLVVWGDTELSRNGIEGTVAPRECTNRYSESGQSWICSGPFTSYDRKVSIERVLIRPDLTHPPGAPEVARVMDAEATEAYTEYDSDPGRLLVGLGFFGWGAWWVMLGLSRLRVHSRWAEINWPD